jgi:transcriptional regulator with XRE-family HTH domain
MNISVNLKRLRRERDLTQEKLAEIIGVVPQAVSKWERGEGLPDITLVPALAAALDVTTDALFGMDEEHRQQRVKEISAEWGRILMPPDGGYHPAEGIAYLREQLRDLPSEWRLWQQLAYALGESVSGYGTDDYNEKNTREAIDIWERIADRCPDLRIRSNAVPILVMIYAHIGEPGRAKEYAQLLPHKNAVYEYIAPIFLKEQELRTFLEAEIADTAWYLNQLTYNAAGMVVFQSEKHHDYVNSEAGYTLNERLEWLEFGIKSLKQLKDKPWGGIWAQESCKNRYTAALLLLKHGDMNRALDYLEKAADYCAPIPGEQKAHITFTSTTSYAGETDVIPTESARKIFLEILKDSGQIEDSAFYPLHAAPRYKALIKKLETGK